MLRSREGFITLASSLNGTSSANEQVRTSTALNGTNSYSLRCHVVCKYRSSSLLFRLLSLLSGCIPRLQMVHTTRAVTTVITTVLISRIHPFEPFPMCPVVKRLLGQAGRQAAELKKKGENSRPFA